MDSPPNKQFSLSSKNFFKTSNLSFSVTLPVNSQKISSQTSNLWTWVSHPENSYEKKKLIGLNSCNQTKFPLVVTFWSKILRQIDFFDDTSFRPCYFPYFCILWMCPKISPLGLLSTNHALWSRCPFRSVVFEPSFLVWEPAVALIRNVSISKQIMVYLPLWLIHNWELSVQLSILRWDAESQFKIPAKIQRPLQSAFRRSQWRRKQCLSQFLCKNPPRKQFGVLNIQSNTKSGFQSGQSIQSELKKASCLLLPISTQKINQIKGPTINSINWETDATSCFPMIADRAEQPQYFKNSY